MTLLLTLDDGSVQRKLADAVEFARAAVLEDAPEEQLGAHVGVSREDAVTASHLFEAQVPGYGGWRWSVTVATAGEDEPVTVSEVVLVPGPSALVAPAWVPWERRVRAGDLGVGDIFPTAENDPRLAPAYLQSDDPAVEEVARETGLGRVHTLSRFGRTDAAERWHAGEFGPRSDMARSAPDVCGTCGFFVPLAGSLRGVFGVCSNDIAPADGHVVDVEYGCGAHSEVEVEVTSSVPVAELVYDDSLLDFTPAASSEVTEAAVAEPEPEPEPEPQSGEVAAEAGRVEAAEPVTAEAAVAAEVAPELGEAEAGQVEVAEPVLAEEAAVEPAAEGVTGPVPVAEPGEAAASAVAEPVEVAEVPESAPSEVAEPPADAPEPVADPAAEPEAAEAPAATGEIAEPVVAEVPEPAEAEPTQAEVTDAIELPSAPEPHEATTEHEAPEIPPAAESDAAEVDPLPAADLATEPLSSGRDESAPAEVAEQIPAETTAAPEADLAPTAVAEDTQEVAEPTQAEVTDAVAEPPVAVVPAAAEAEASQGEHSGDEAESGDAPQAGEVPEAVLTDNVVTEASPADEAQAQVDDASGR